MPFFQDVVHRTRLATGSGALKFLLAVLAWILLALIYDLRAWRNLSTIEGMDSAQLARHIAQGHGYTTSFVRPLSLGLVAKKNPAIANTNAPAAAWTRQPDVSNPPL